VKLDAQQSAELVRAVRSGEHLPVVAARFGVRRDTARLHCYKAGITTQQLREIRRLVEASCVAVHPPEHKAEPPHTSTEL
jgi:hypothetical protein